MKLRYKIFLSVSLFFLGLFVVLFVWFIVDTTPRWNYDKAYRRLLIEALIDYPVAKTDSDPLLLLLNACPGCERSYNYYIKLKCERDYFNGFVAYHDFWSPRLRNQSDRSKQNIVYEFASHVSESPELMIMFDSESKSYLELLYREIDWWDPDTTTCANNYGTYYDRNDNIRYKYWGRPPINYRIITQYHNGYMYIFIDVG